MQIKDITEGGLLARASVRTGFVITHINDKEVLTVADLSKINESISSIDGVYPDGKAAGYHFVN